MKKSIDLAPRVQVDSQQELRHWLEKHHLTSQGVWLVRYKKGSRKYFSIECLVKELLCFGWIDSLPRKLDADRSLLYISPRKPRSNWSRVNKEYIQELLAAGRMADKGIHAIETAKLNGRWSFLDEIEQGVLPQDVAEALSDDERAARHFAAFPKSVKKGILEWIINAAKDSTRQDRISKMVNCARENKRVKF